MTLSNPATKEMSKAFLIPKTLRMIITEILTNNISINNPTKYLLSILLLVLNISLISLSMPDGVIANKLCFTICSSLSKKKVIKSTQSVPPRSIPK